MNSSTSLVRIILTDQNYNEYLIYETYSILAEEPSFSINQIGEETIVLNQIIPVSISVEITDATVFLKEIVYSTEKLPIKTLGIDEKRQQQLDKINRINNNINKKGLKWMAGETFVSKMTYSEKKKLFGGVIPNLQGFDYYIGGIFVLENSTSENINSEASSTSTQSPDQSPYVKEFSWRNRHGEDWTTPVTNQLNCGSCWAFAATGATETLVNLYYNQHLDLDLSEQDILSCSRVGNCEGGAINAALGYIMNFGIVNESCFPYQADDLACEIKCINPQDIISFNSLIYSSYYTENIKKYIINGATAISVSFWKHALTLVGYKVLEEGDSIFIKTNDLESCKKIPEGDPLIGQTAWLCKNSWSKQWGDNGFCYIAGNEPVFIGFSVSGPVTSLNYDDSNIICEDNDGDGYYNWGIGAKPLQCPVCPDEPDGDDSDPCMKFLDEYGHLVSIIPPPVAKDTTILMGENVQALTAIGENIKWYSDEDLVNLVYSGNIYNTGNTDLGIYQYYVTQTSSGCESNSTEVTLKILPESPIVEDVLCCEGQQNITLSTTGENIKWYSANNNLTYDNRDYQLYETVTIGEQTWMKENLNFYTDSGSWYYNNDSIQYAKTYGRLYNWETAINACPDGWHLPSYNEWSILVNYIGGLSVAGGKLKEKGYDHWSHPNEGATNEFGFTALPAGGRFIWGFDGFKHVSVFGSSMSLSTDKARGLYLSTGLTTATFFSYEKSAALSVRCIKDSATPLLFIGNTLNINNPHTGTYGLYVTQTIDGVESLTDTVHLDIHPQNHIEISEVICNGDSVQIGNSVFKQTGNYSVSLINQYNCDSVVNINLQVLNNPVVFLGADITIFSTDTLTLNAGEGFETYEWNTGETTQSIQINGLSGVGEKNYWVFVTDTENCFGSDTILITIHEATNVDFITKDYGTIKLYPNPTNGKLFLEVENIPEKIKIIIYSETGKTVYSSMFKPLHSHVTKELDLSKYPSGNYIIKIENKKISKTQKFILKK